MKLSYGKMLLAIAIGLLIGWFDLLGTSDDSTKVTLFLLVLGGAIAGAMQPVKPWRMALAVGPGLAIVHLIAYALGYADHVEPNTLLTRLSLLPVGIIAAGIGAYVGAFARTAGKRAPSMD